MRRLPHWLAIVVLSAAVSPATASSPIPPAAAEQSAYPPSPEATRFFEQLVERYRSLIRYTDSFLFEQRIGSIDGDQQSEVHTSVRARSRIDRDELVVSTRARALTESAAGSTEPGPARQAQREVDLAIAPHLRLRYVDEPLREFRPGGEGFRATGITTVELENQPMVRVELRSDGASPGEPGSVFGLTVDPHSMLIRKVDGEERLADGRQCTTSISIDPSESEVIPATDESEPSEPPAPPVDLPAVGGLVG